MESAMKFFGAFLFMAIPLLFLLIAKRERIENKYKANWGRLNTLINKFLQCGNLLTIEGETRISNLKRETACPPHTDNISKHLLYASLFQIVISFFLFIMILMFFIVDDANPTQAANFKSSMLSIYKYHIEGDGIMDTILKGVVNFIVILAILFWHSIFAHLKYKHMKKAVCATINKHVGVSASAEINSDGDEPTMDDIQAVIMLAEESDKNKNQT
ncbi:MAG: hypothetical protein AB2826_24205 [Candidatus Thiodiazotropha sp.]